MKRTLSTFALAYCSLLPLTALAEPAPTESAAPEPAAAAAPAEKVKVTAIAMPHPNVDDATLVEVMRAVDNGLKKNDKLDMKDIDTRLSEFAQEVPQDQLSAAKQAATDGNQALTDGNAQVAVQKLDEAVTQLAKVLPYIKKQELADAMAALGVARYMAGDKVGGHREFIRLLTWRPDYSYDPAKLPPQYLDDFSAAQTEMEKVKRGSIKIESTPPGAQAYVDGKFEGVTPCAVDMLAAGEHFITLKKEGFFKAVQPGTVVPKKDVKVTVALQQNEKYLLIQQAIEALNGTIGGEKEPEEMSQFREALFIDQAVFVRVKPQGADKLDVESWLYDLRTKIRLSHINKTVDKAQAETQLQDLAKQLYVNVNYSGELALPEEKLPPKPKERPPLWKTWWFWTAVGAVLVGAAAIAVGVVETRPAACPDGDICPQIKY